MAWNSANITSPEVIKRFRNQLVDFGSEARNELEGMGSDVQKVLNWLQVEQLTFWKARLRKREEAVLVAKSAFIFAQHAGATGRDSAEEERIILKRAQRSLEEARLKIKTIKKWTLRINQEIIKELKPVQILSANLAALIPKAVHRLDEMLDNLDIYLRQTSTPSKGNKH